jgi:galactose-1-phosphate uridylyltransferase (family 1)
MRPLTEPHRRYNPLSDEWVLVSADRTDRPWQGTIDATSSAAAVAYDPSCYLCPGNTRANGDANPAYTSTFAFTNDFAALRRDTTHDRVEEGLLGAKGEPGTCRVVCYDPRHDQTMAQLSHAHVYPPLLRSATVRKFMVGYELLAEPQRDITPEDAAAHLRRFPTTHYASTDR